VSTATRVVGPLLILACAGAAMSMFGNPDPKPEPEHTSAPAAPSSAPTHRHVVIRFEHREAKNPMHVKWDFGSGLKKGSQDIDPAVVAFDIDEIVPIGYTVYGSVQPSGGIYDPPEAVKVQIKFDGRPQCPDHFFGRGQVAECSRTVK
jgi:hypothetical protein